MSKYIIFISLFVVMMSCKNNTNKSDLSENKISDQNQTKFDPPDAIHEITGKTMGTYYKIKYTGNKIKSLINKLDNTLIELNHAVSTYENNSLISQFNQHKSTSSFSLDKFDKTHQQFFIDNFKITKRINKLSFGAYDPTVMPLVNYWGFGYDGKTKVTKIDSALVKKLVSEIGIRKVNLRDNALTKESKSLELDFSSVAKGYGVDKISELMDELGVDNYYIEIGGECKAKGEKSGKAWTIGISYPDTSARMADVITKIPLWNNAVATSGNYRNYYNSNGHFISHTINPVTGYTEQNNLLSATVFYQDCATADALATACMSMGYQKAFVMIDELKGAECYLVWVNQLGKVQESMTAEISKLMF